MSKEGRVWTQEDALKAVETTGKPSKIGVNGLVSNVTIEWDDRWALFLTIERGDWGTQNVVFYDIRRGLDIMRQVFNVDKPEHAKGKACRLVDNNGFIKGLGHIIKDEYYFVQEEWDCLIV